MKNKLLLGMVVIALAGCDGTQTPAKPRAPYSVHPGALDLVNNVLMRRDGTVCIVTKPDSFIAVAKNLSIVEEDAGHKYFLMTPTGLEEISKGECLPYPPGTDLVRTPHRNVRANK